MITDKPICLKGFKNYVLAYLQFIFYLLRLHRVTYAAYYFRNIYAKRRIFYKDVDKSMLSVIAVTYNSGHCLDGSLRIFENLNIKKDVEIIIIDNNSKDKAYLKEYERKPGHRVVYNSENLFFTKAVNQGMRLARGGMCFC
jgi:hypothetical protein